MGDLLTSEHVFFRSLDDSVATVSGNTVTWKHGGTALITAKDSDIRVQLESGDTAHDWMKPDNTSLKGGMN